MKKMYLSFFKAVSTFALALTVVDVNALGCFVMFHQPKLPKSADRLKIK